MAGNFVPRLPTFNTTVINYIFDPLSGTRSLGSGFLAQMYPPFRSSDNAGPSDAYIVFPKTVTEIHDPAEYNDAGTDAVVFNWQGIDWPYKVIQLLPRWLNFPNEHYLALLQRMTAAEYANILTPDAPGLPEWNVTLPVYHVIDSVVGSTFKANTPAKVVDIELTHHADTNTSLYVLLPNDSSSFVDVPGSYTETAPFEYDAVEIEWPTGSGQFRYYLIEECETRLHALPGEHIRCCLARVGIEEVTLWFGEPPSPSHSSIAASPITVLNDGTAATTISGTMLTSLSLPVIAASVVISSSGSAVVSGPTVTDSSGNWSVTATDTIAETVTFTAVCLGVSVGPSNSVTYGSLPPSFDIDTTMTTGNGSCTNCSDLNGGFNLPTDSPGSYTSAPFALTCISSQGDAFWQVVFGASGGHNFVELLLFESPIANRICYWRNDNIDSWDGVSPLSLPFVFDDSGGTCAWANPITITPGA